MDCSSTESALVVPSAAPPHEESDGKRMKKELSEDDILEILARLPVKSLIRFKSVSKRWYSLIISPNFITLHYKHNSHPKNNQVSLWLYSSEKNLRNIVSPLKTSVCFGLGSRKKKLNFHGHFDYVEMLGCFNGVVCLSLSERPQKYALWNPATRQLMEIGDAPMDGPASNDMAFIRNGSWYGSGFCFDTVTNAFKVAQIRLTVTEAGETRARVNVFSTAANSWTEKNIPVPYRIRLSGSSHSSAKCVATCVNGYIHWHITLIRIQGFHGGLSLEKEDSYILSYNMNGEVFKRIEVPSSPVYNYYHLTTYNGSLALFAHVRTGSHLFFDEVDLWVLNDSGGDNHHSWTKLLSCKPPFKIRLAVGFFRKDNVDLILLDKAPRSSLYLYDPETEQTQKFWMKNIGRHTFLYSETLALLN